MRNVFKHTALAIALCVPMAGVQAGEAASQSAVVAVNTETAVATPRGTTFIVPQGWGHQRHGSAT